jgi:hypothetical protein
LGSGVYAGYVLAVRRLAVPAAMLVMGAQRFALME